MDDANADGQKDRSFCNGWASGIFVIILATAPAKTIAMGRMSLSSMCLVQ